MSRKLCLVMTFFAAIACSPRQELDQVIKRHHFIPFHLPMESFRVGTILRGSNDNPLTVAPPERCFPDRAEGKPALRWIQKTDLENQTRAVEVNFSVDINPLLNAGNNVLTFKAGANIAHKVQMEFTGATVEFLDEDAFDDYYSTEMSERCRGHLLKHGFIGKALRVEGLKFVFLDQWGGKINLKVNLEKIVDINAGVDWKVEATDTLIINSPKYIGYQMSRIIEKGHGLEGIEYATKVDLNGDWQYEDVDPRMQNPPMPEFMPAANAVPAEPL